MNPRQVDHSDPPACTSNCTSCRHPPCYRRGSWYRRMSWLPYAAKTVCIVVVWGYYLAAPLVGWPILPH